MNATAEVTKSWKSAAYLFDESHKMIWMNVLRYYFFARLFLFVLFLEIPANKFPVEWSDGTNGSFRKLLTTRIKTFGNLFDFCFFGINSVRLSGSIRDSISLWTLSWYTKLCNLCVWIRSHWRPAFWNYPACCWVNEPAQNSCKFTITSNRCRISNTCVRF